jgi:hypothetical protein
MVARKRKRISETKESDAGKEIREELTPEIQDELEKILTQGLKLQLETVRRKNPYFKGSRRGSEQLSPPEYKRAAMSLARVVTKMHLLAFRLEHYSSPN